VRAGVRLLLIDNHDSFTWNLAQYFLELGADLRVELNDAPAARQALFDGPQAVVISPGPGRPEDGGISLEVVRYCSGNGVPLLGVCLGHQVIAQAFGARIVQAPTLMHGKTSLIEHDGTGLFVGLPQPFEATRYHSLVVDPPSLPPGLAVSARTAGGVIMGIRHLARPLWGVQFHPESILTPSGKSLLENFLNLAAAAPAATV
jgi:anthranilate synthase/aminodeoxychorismate synthase-like glutamine amidotransferase